MERYLVRCVFCTKYRVFDRVYIWWVFALLFARRCKKLPNQLDSNISRNIGDDAICRFQNNSRLTFYRKKCSFKKYQRYYQGESYVMSLEILTGSTAAKHLLSVLYAVKYSYLKYSCMHSRFLPIIFAHIFNISNISIQVSAQIVNTYLILSTLSTYDKIEDTIENLENN